MKRKVIIAAVAICVAVVIALLPQIPFVMDSADGDSIVSGSDTSLKTVSLNDYRIDSDGFLSESTAVDTDEILANCQFVDATQDNKIKAVATGTTVMPINLNNVIRDSLASSVSVNVYTFSVAERGVLVFAFTHADTDETGSCIWKITLYEEYSADGTGDSADYRVLEQVSYTTIGESVKSSTIGVSPGNYKVSVECVTGYVEDKYDIAVGYAQADDYEIEPNNAKTRYSELSLDKTINGSASSLEDGNDEDWYLFKISETGYTVLYFEHEADSVNSANTVAWRIKLTDIQGNEYFYTTSGMGAESINSGIMGLAPGYYFVTVYSHLYTSAPYELAVSFSKDSAIETELNDSADSATPISTGKEIVGALTARDSISDRDYYSFKMEKDGYVKLDFTHEALSESYDGWNVSIVSSEGAVAYSTVSDWTEAQISSPEIGLTAGDYCIVIDSDNIYHCNIVYKLLLTTTYDSTWESEPNNTPETADAIKLGSAKNGSLIENGVDYDMDYYTLSVSSSGTLRVTFTHSSIKNEDKEGWVISIVDAEGNVVASSSAKWNSGTVSFTANVTSGTYYVLVETGLYYTGDSYSVTATFG